MEARGPDDYLSIYRQFARSEGKSERTIEATLLAVNKFTAFLGPDVPVDAVTATDLRNFILHLQSIPKWQDHPTIRARGDPLSPFSIATYVRHTRAYWSWLEREGFIAENPFVRVKPPRTPVRRIPAPGPDEVGQLLRVIPRTTHTGYRDVAILVTLYGTGFRLGELLGVKVADVTFENGEIRVRGKGNRERAVYMSPTVFTVLLTYRRKWRPVTSSPYFFIGKDGRPPSRHTIAHNMQRYCQMAGLAPGHRRSPHGLRHGYAVQFLRNGGETFNLQAIMGHADITTTRQYVVLADQDVEKQMLAFSPAENLDRDI
jgi:site-specific recombinase XerD